jgi:alpha-tubulin suppressor-like RCC1 family protein
VLAVVVGSSHCMAVGKAGDCFVWGNGYGKLSLTENCTDEHCGGAVTAVNSVWVMSPIDRKYVLITPSLP